MSIIQFVDALAITVATSPDGRPEDVPSLPMIILEVDPRGASTIARELLIPFAKPEHALAGYYRHADGKMTLGCYLAIPVSDSGHELVVLGNEIDLAVTTWVAFNQRRQECGKFCISVGPFLGISDYAALSEPHWFLEMTEFHLKDIAPMLHDRLDLPTAHNT